MGLTLAEEKREGNSKEGQGMCSAGVMRSCLGKVLRCSSERALEGQWLMGAPGRRSAGVLWY